MLYLRGNGERGTWRPLMLEDGRQVAAIFCPVCGRRSQVSEEPDQGHMIECPYCGTYSLVTCQGWGE